MLVVSTASAYKFAGDVLLSLTGSKPVDDLQAPTMLRDATNTQIPSPLLEALSKDVIHTDVHGKDKESMTKAVFTFANK